MGYSKTHMYKNATFDITICDYRQTVLIKKIIIDGIKLSEHFNAVLIKKSTKSYIQKLVNKQIKLAHKKIDERHLELEKRLSTKTIANKLNFK